MQAIETKFFGPTNFKSARIRARCQARTIFVAWDHALGIEGNHDAAAKTLAEKLGWHGDWHGGGNSSGSGNIYVVASDPTFVVERRVEMATPSCEGAEPMC
jgi:hypothetical protein